MIMSLPCVLALNSLQNAMMLMPCGPSAGPDGRGRVGLAGRELELDDPVTFFAMTFLCSYAARCRVVVRHAGSQTLFST